MKVFSPIPHTLEKRFNKCEPHENDLKFVFDGINSIEVPDEIIAGYKKTYPEKYLNEEETAIYKSKNDLAFEVVEEKVYPFEPQPDLTPKKEVVEPEPIVEEEAQDLPTLVEDTETVEEPIVEEEVVEKPKAKKKK